MNKKKLDKTLISNSPLSEAEYFKSIIESSDDAIIGRDLNGTILSWNKGAEKLYGFTKKEVIGKSVCIIFPKDRIFEFDLISEKLKKGLKTRHLETERVTKTGKRVFVSVTVSPIKDKHNNIIGAATTARDINERKRLELAQERLLKRVQTAKDEAELSRQHLQDLFKQAPTIVAIHSGRNLVYELVSDELQHIIGKNVQMIGKPFVEVFPEQTVFLDALKTVYRTGQTVRLKEYRPNIGKNLGEAKDRIYNIIFQPIHDRDSRVTGVMHLAYDITEQVLSKQKIQEILESISDAFYAIDDQWRFTYINKRAEQLWGIERNKLLGKNLWDIFPESKGSVGYKKHHFAMKHRQLVQFETLSPLLSAWLEVTICPTKSGLSVYFRDITERKQLEQRKDEFIAIASHELKTPITSLKMYSQTLERQFKDHSNDTLKKYFETANKQLNRLTEIIHNLLDVSRAQQKKLIYQKLVFYIDDFVTETVENMQLVATRHKIILKGQAHFKVLADRDRIGQVLVNLINNAIKYSPQANKIVVLYKQDKNKVIVSVEDFGFGISKMEQDKIFDRFYQISHPDVKTFPGLGLGLYISREIISQHNGLLWVNSQEGKGSTFSFSLPLLKNKSKKQPRNKHVTI
jgi:PAS domain S-box-containing protein